MFADVLYWASFYAGLGFAAVSVTITSFCFLHWLQVGARNGRFPRILVKIGTPLMSIPSAAGLFAILSTIRESRGNGFQDVFILFSIFAFGFGVLALYLLPREKK